jgi:hypothetical protein
VSTVVGVATGMFTLRDQVFPGEAGSAGAMSTSAYGERVGRICDVLNDNDRRRAHDDSGLEGRLLRAETTIDQRNELLDAVRRAIARDGQALASFTGLAAPTALASVRHDTGVAWSRNLARLRDYALRLDQAGTRARLVDAIDHLSTVRPLLAADRVKVAAGLERIGAADCDLQPQRVTKAFTLPEPREARRAQRLRARRHHDHATAHPSVTSSAPAPRNAVGGGPARRSGPAPTPSTPSANTPAPVTPPRGGGSANTPGGGGVSGGEG